MLAVMLNFSVVCNNTSILLLIEMIISTTPTQCWLLVDLSHLLLEYTHKHVLGKLPHKVNSPQKRYTTQQ